LDRAQNSAATSPLKGRILQFIVEHSAILEEAARAGVVPVSAISEPLHVAMGPELNSSMLKQYVGLCVVAVLEDLGYRVVRRRVRIKNDPLFGVGALFSREAAHSPESDEDLLQRILDTLSVPELMVAERYIRTRLSQLSPQATGGESSG